MPYEKLIENNSKLQAENNRLRREIDRARMAIDDVHLFLDGVNVPKFGEIIPRLQQIEWFMSGEAEPMHSPQEPLTLDKYEKLIDETEKELNADA